MTEILSKISLRCFTCNSLSRSCNIHQRLARHTVVASLLVPRFHGSFENNRFPVGAGMLISVPQDIVVSVTHIADCKHLMGKMVVKIPGDKVMHLLISCLKLLRPGARGISCGQCKMHMAVKNGGEIVQWKSLLFG